MRFSGAFVAVVLSGVLALPVAVNADGEKAQQTAQQSGGAQALGPDMVREVQKKLNDKGYDAGDVDGVFGDETREAVKSFQQKEGLKATGQLDQKTLSALGVKTGGQQKQGSGGSASPPTEPKKSQEEKSQ